MPSASAKSRFVKKNDNKDVTSTVLMEINDDTLLKKTIASLKELSNLPENKAIKLLTFLWEINCKLDD